jgi:hypothetical protein
MSLQSSRRPASAQGWRTEPVEEQAEDNCQKGLQDSHASKQLHTNIQRI